MPKRIHEDHQDFQDVIGGRKRKALKKFIKTGSIFRRRGKNGKISITIPRIDIPHILFGDPEDGVGRGKGKPGDVVGRDPQKGKGDQAGNDHGEGIEINVDVDEILKELEDELQLPNLKPKPNQTLKEERIKYNDISLVGPESLRHNRRTFQQALKRCCAGGQSKEMIYRPGFVDPIPGVSVINSDKRYRQFKVIEEPSSNAVIFFARDWSGSMDQYKCDIVSDMSWWIELFISRHYKRVERVYVGHDTVAEECDKKKFYNYRYGGGTNCSSAFQFISKQFENRFPPNQWNVYVLYFTDGDNWNDDNENLVKCLKTDFTPQVANLVALTQVMSWRYDNSVKARIDQELKSGGLNSEIIRTTKVGSENPPTTTGWGGGTSLTDEERDAQIKRAIGDILGAERKKAEVA
jgi:uncharacterized sporulation protein YeaH/YhbH (DUF444 family)